VDVAAAAGAVREAPFNSRRVQDATVHANEAAAGSLLLPPTRSHDHSAPLMPEAGATLAAVITGGDPNAEFDACDSAVPATDGPEAASESPTGTETKSVMSETRGAISGTRREPDAAPLSDGAREGAVAPNVGKR
jgi:hypothetical protein